MTKRSLISERPSYKYYLRTQNRALCHIATFDLRANHFRNSSYIVDHDSSVGIAIRYELDGQGIKSLYRRDFPDPSRAALASTQPPTQSVPCLFLRGKVAGVWR
jgi:hypothetical protein